MGSICDSCYDSSEKKKAKYRTAERKAQAESIALIKGEIKQHIAFNEVCLARTKFQCTLITTKSNKNECKIISHENMSFIDLYNAGHHRITDVTKLTQNNEFYTLIRKFNKQKSDETEIHKYKVTRTNNTLLEHKINIQFVETTFKGLDKNKGINMEGIEIIESQNNEMLGFLLCNDYFAKPPNSNLYFLNLKGQQKIIYSFNDNGISENGGIVQYKGFGKDGYLILPQFLLLGRKAIFKDKNIKKFIQWSLKNNDKAFLYFIKKTDILQLIKSSVMDDNKEFEDEKMEIEAKIEKVYVVLNENYKSNKSLFVQYRNYENEGFEAISIDSNNNVVLTVEYTKYNDTFNCIVTGKICEIGDTETKDDVAVNLQLIIDPCQYIKIENNGGGKNHGQEALLYIR